MMKLRCRLHHEDGAAAVEFALIAGVLAMLIFGMLQFGLAFFELQNLRAATREGARYGAVDASVDGIQSKVASYVGVPALHDSVVVSTRATPGASPVPVPQSSAKPCVPASPAPAPDSVIASIPLNTAPQSVKDIFTIDIPLMPTISMLNATVSGEFRCES